MEAAAEGQDGEQRKREGIGYILLVAKEKEGTACLRGETDINVMAAGVGSRCSSEKQICY